MHATLQLSGSAPASALVPGNTREAAPRSTATPILLVAGLGDSGADHWQTLWRRDRPTMRRVVQDDWDVPDLAAWAAGVARAIDAVRRPPVVVAHGFGCLAAVHAATFYRRRLAGALLVAPSDPQRWRIAPLLTHAPLPFRVTVVASTNDPWHALARAARLAAAWGARLVTYTGAGHINAESGFGAWPEGRALLAELLAVPAAATASATS